MPDPDDEYSEEDSVNLEGVFGPQRKPHSGVMVTPFMSRESLKSVIQFGEFTKLVSDGLFMCIRGDCEYVGELCEGEKCVIFCKGKVHYSSERRCIKCRTPMSYVSGYCWIEYISPDDVEKVMKHGMRYLLGEATRLESGNWGLGPVQMLVDLREK